MAEDGWTWTVARGESRADGAARPATIPASADGVLAEEDAPEGAEGAPHAAGRDRGGPRLAPVLVSVLVSVQPLQTWGRGAAAPSPIPEIIPSPSQKIRSSL